MATPSKKKKRQPEATHFTLRMDEETRQRLELVAAHFAINQTAVLRMLLKREADRIEAERAAMPRAKRIA